MKDRDAPAWDALAQHEPYFPLLDNGSDATQQFFESGESDIAALLSAIASLLGHDVRLTSVLDFGCGAGRLTLPLARRAQSVVACDVSPTILAHVRENARAAGLHHVTCIETRELPTRADGEFTFICSLLALQYVRPASGYALIRSLLRTLAPNGIAALQLTFERPRAATRRLAYLTHNRWPFAHRQPPHSELPDVRLNEYQEDHVQTIIEAAGAETLALFPTRQDGAPGGVLVVRKFAEFL